MTFWRRDHKWKKEVWGYSVSLLPWYKKLYAYPILFLLYWLFFKPLMILDKGHGVEHYDKNQ